MNSTALMRGVEDLRGRGPEPLVVISDDELHARKPRSARERRNAVQNGRLPTRRWPRQHFAPPIRVHAHRDYHSDRDDPARLARLR